MTEFPAIDLPDIGNINVLPQANIIIITELISPQLQINFVSLFEMEQGSTQLSLFCKKQKKTKTKKKKAVLCVSLYGGKLTNLQRSHLISDKQSQVLMLLWAPGNKNISLLISINLF